MAALTLIQQFTTTRPLSATCAMMGGMSHDPLCPYGDEFSVTAPDQCQPCALIVKVRADTLDKVYAWLSDCSPAPIDPGAPCADAFRTGYDLGRIRSREAVNAMRGVRV